MSEITLPVPELKAALPGFSKIVGKSRTLPVLQSVRIQRNDQGAVTIEGTDLDAHLAYRLKDAQSGDPVSVLIPFDTLTKTAKGSADTLTLIPDGKDKIRLRYNIGNNPVEQRISTPELKKWPEAPKFNQPAVALDKEFGPTLKQAMQCSSTDSSRRVLQGAHLDVSDKKAHYVVGTNGRILYSANSFCFDLKQSVTIPNLKFFGWAGFHAEECKLALNDDAQNRWLRMESGPWTITARQVEGVYPNWRQVVPKPDSKGTTLKLSPEAIEQLLTVIPQLPGLDNDNSGLRLRATTELFIEGRNKEDKEWTSIAVQGASITGKPVQIMLNRHYLIQALRYGLSQINIQDELSPLLFSQGGRKMVVMPLRPDSTTQPTKVEPVKSAPIQVAEKPTPTEMKETQMPKENKEIKDTNKPVPQLPLIDQVEQIKEALKNVIRDLATLAESVKQAERDRRVGEREVESARAVLKKLQQVSI